MGVRSHTGAYVPTVKWDGSPFLPPSINPADRRGLPRQAYLQAYRALHSDTVCVCYAMFRTSIRPQQDSSSEYV